MIGAAGASLVCLGWPATTKEYEPASGEVVRPTERKRSHLFKFLPRSGLQLNTDQLRLLLVTGAVSMTAGLLLAEIKMQDACVLCQTVSELMHCTIAGRITTD